MVWVPGVGSVVDAESWSSAHAVAGAAQAWRRDGPGYRTGQALELRGGRAVRDGNDAFKTWNGLSGHGSPLPDVSGESSRCGMCQEARAQGYLLVGESAGLGVPAHMRTPVHEVHRLGGVPVRQGVWP